jgi:hypothetical protein
MNPIVPLDEALEPTTEVISILEEFLTKLEAGARLNPEDLTARCPALAEPLKACLASLEFLHGRRPPPCARSTSVASATSSSSATLAAAAWVSSTKPSKSHSVAALRSRCCRLRPRSMGGSCSASRTKRRPPPACTTRTSCRSSASAASAASITTPCSTSRGKHWPRSSRTCAARMIAACRAPAPYRSIGVPLHPRRPRKLLILLSSTSTRRRRWACRPPLRWNMLISSAWCIAIELRSNLPHSQDQVTSANLTSSPRLAAH